MKIINNNGIDLTIEKNSLFMSLPKNKNGIIKIFSGEDSSYSVSFKEGVYTIASIKEDHFDTIMKFSRDEFLEILDYLDEIMV